MRPKQIQYDEFEELTGRHEIEDENLLAYHLLYAPQPDFILQNKLNMESYTFNELCDRLEERKVIEKINTKEGVYIGLTKEKRQEHYLTFKKGYDALTCHFEFDENNMIVNCRFFHNREDIKITIPLVNFFLCLKQDLLSLDLAIPIIPYNTFDKIPRDHEGRMHRFIPKDLRRKILKEQNYQCKICGCYISDDSDHWPEARMAHIDHKHPYSKMMTYKNGFHRINERKNLQATCAECNMRKSNKV